jgi:hypothetical protein
MRENKSKDTTDNKKKGPVIPAGTEQETGLTRGQTEKPELKKSRNKKKAEKN